MPDLFLAQLFDLLRRRGWLLAVAFHGAEQRQQERRYNEQLSKRALHGVDGIKSIGVTAWGRLMMRQLPASKRES
ncbi:MAG: hypothetical protein H0T51_20370 [Pirellulales bacterium]|nr:hypothetical protein [Pirellulales bacterium]